MPRWAPIEALGLKYGRLLVIEDIGHRNHARRVRCRCDCGKEIEIQLNSLRSGHSKSCGCQRRSPEWLAKQKATIIETKTVHGEAGKTPEYNCWRLMKYRCHNPRGGSYANYGGRGISVCQEWRDDFQAFLDAMGRRPSDKHSIDRIDNDGNYEPGNCRWATHEQQVANRRVTRRLSAFGRVQSVTEWGKEFGIRGGAIKLRIDRYGWDVEAAISTPLLTQVEITKRASAASCTSRASASKGAENAAQDA